MGFLLFIRTASILGFSTKFATIIHIIASSLSELMVFMLIMFLNMLGVCIFAFSVFGNRIYNYSDMLLSFLQLLKIFKGDVNYNEIRVVDVTLAEVMLVYILFVFQILLLNMIIGIQFGYYYTFN